MNKNTRLTLAAMGVLILVLAGLLISNDKKSTKATEQSGATPAATTPATGAAGSTGSTSGGGATSGGGSNTGGATSGGNGTGGASPQDGNGTGGAKPEDQNTGGAKVSTQQGPLLVAGKVAKITVTKGDTVYLRALSAMGDELHIHGYDYKVNLPAGKTVSYKFKADIGGAFVMEFEKQSLQVAQLKVNP